MQDLQEISRVCDISSQNVDPGEVLPSIPPAPDNMPLFVTPGMAPVTEDEMEGIDDPLDDPFVEECGDSCYKFPLSVDMGQIPSRDGGVWVKRTQPSSYVFNGSEELMEHMRWYITSKFAIAVKSNFSQIGCLERCQEVLKNTH